MSFPFWILIFLQLWCCIFSWMVVDTALGEAPHLRLMNASLESRLASSASIINSQKMQIAALTETVELLKTPNQ